MDILIEIETEHVSFPEKQRIRQSAGELSMEYDIVLFLLMVDRTHRELTDEEIQRIARTYHAWRSVGADRDLPKYKDLPGLRPRYEKTSKG